MHRISVYPPERGRLSWLERGLMMLEEYLMTPSLRCARYMHAVSLLSPGSGVLTMARACQYSMGASVSLSVTLLVLCSELQWVWEVFCGVWRYLTHQDHWFPIQKKQQWHMNIFMSETDPGRYVLWFVLVLLEQSGPTRLQKNRKWVLKSLNWDWREITMITSADCSFTGPRLGSQHPLSSPEGLAPSSGSWGYCLYAMHRQNTHTSKYSFWS